MLCSGIMKPSSCWCRGHARIVAALLFATLAGPVSGAPPETVREDLEVERLVAGVWRHTSYEEDTAARAAASC
jgi:hypothetical protein